MVTLERAHTSRRVGWPSLLGLLLVPLLVAGGFLWATWGSTTRLDRVQAAVVNLDEPVKVNGQLVPLGRQLAGGLVTGGDQPTEQNFSWLLTDASDAASGVASGRYAAVVTIPANFSARATSFSKTEAAEIGPAELTVVTSSVGGLADAAIGQAISAAATSTLNSALTRQYLEQIYVGFNETGKQFSTVAKAAGQLSDGTTKLSDGVATTATGAGKLADGLDQLDTGAAQLATGAGKLSTGAGQLASGLNQLADGTKELPAKTRTLADGTAKLADGGTGLAKGVKELSTGTDQNAAGLRSYAAGVQPYRDRLNAFASLPPADLAQAVPCPAPLVAAGQCAGFYAGFVGGTQAAVQGLGDQPKVSGAKPPKTPKTCLTLPRQKSGTTPGLLRATNLLCTGGNDLATGVKEDLVPGTSALSGGLTQLATGTDQLANGLKPLAKGIAQTATGATQLSTGVSQIATGTQGLATGAHQSAVGAGKLSGGLDQLATGASKLATGSSKLADGLATGAEKVPSYDKTTRTKLAEVVAAPVTQERPDSLFSNVATTTYLAIVALWLGALASFLVLRAVPARALTSMRSAWRLTVDALWPAAAIAGVQAVVLTGLFQLLLGLDAGQVIGLAGVLLLAGVGFAALNQALVAWWGGVGRFVSVALVVLTAASALTSAVPPALTSLVPFLPLTPALEGARAVVTGGGGAWGAAGLLAAWLVIGVIAALLAVARRRMLPAPALALA